MQLPMLKSIRLLALGGIFLCSGMPLAEAAENVLVPPGCEMANRSTIPNGDAVTKTQLLEAKINLEKYLEKAGTYLSCLKRYEDSFGEEIDGDKRVTIITSHNKIVDEMYLAGDEFNVALRKFNRRSNPK